MNYLWIISTEIIVSDFIRRDITVNYFIVFKDNKWMVTAAATAASNILTKRISTSKIDIIIDTHRKEIAITFVFFETAWYWK